MQAFSSGAKGFISFKPLNNLIFSIDEIKGSHSRLSGAKKSGIKIC